MPDNTVYRVLPITILLALVLAACSSVAIIPQPETPYQNDPVAGENGGVPEEEAAVAGPTSTVTPTPTETQVVDQVEQLLTAYLAGEIKYPVSRLTEEQKLAFEAALAKAEASLSYKQRQNLIKDRWQYGNKAFEALVKEDGNLEYYDGTWHTLEAMKNLNGEIIPWGEMYDLLSEEGRNNLIANVLAGDAEMIEKVGKRLRAYKNDAEKNGVDHSNFNVLFIQFFPNVESAFWQPVGERTGYDAMNGLLVTKNTQGKLYVIEINTAMNQDIYITHLTSNKVIAHEPFDILKMKAYQDGFMGIHSEDSIRYLLLNVLDDSEIEINYNEKRINSNIENFLEQLNNNPEAINDGLYDVRDAIFFN